MARVDLNKNRESLLKAHKEVFDSKNPINWALYGYEGQTNVLKVVEKGDGGIEEMVDELNSGKCMYAYCSVKDPNTGLNKYVLINWQGEGAPELRKGACAHHVRDVANLLKGAHVTINARTDDDVDEDTIIDKVSKSSGANYSIHKEKAAPLPEAGPVGSVYQKVRPQIEIKPKLREEFWEKTQKEEKARQEAEKKRNEAERRKLADETKTREASEAKARDEREKERLRKIEDQRAAEARANKPDKAKQQAEWEKQQQASLADAEERAKRADRLRQERAQEAKALVGQRSDNPRAVFGDRRRSQFDEDDKPAPVKASAPSRKLNTDFLRGSSDHEAAPRKPISLPQEDPGNPAVLERPGTETEETTPTYQPEPLVQEPEPQREPTPEPVVPQQPQTRNLLAEGLPPRQDSDEEEEDQDWDEPTEEDVTPSVPQVTQQTTPSYEEEDDTYDEVTQSAVAPSEPLEEEDDIYDEAVGAGQSARAIYDYQAAEENEITFDPDDIITNIEQIDSGWWVGTAPDGQRGMFPANYVELI